MGDLSQHFSTHEFACPHCGQTKISGKLIDALEKLHAMGPEPIIVLSGYRCPEHNAEIGGAPHSEHMEGIAADIKIQGLTLQRQYDRAMQVPEFAQGGIGVYDGKFLHVDVRDGKARWARKGGVYLGIDTLVNV